MSTSAAGCNRPADFASTNITIEQGEHHENLHAFFFTDANYAEHEIEADTPEQALATARALEEADDGSLYFENYDSAQPVDEITIRDEAGDDLATWMSDGLRLRLAADDLLDAMKLIIQPYGELLKGMGADLADCEKYQAAVAAIAKAEPRRAAA